MSAIRFLYKRSLIAIHPGRKLVRRYFLDEAMKSVTRAETIEAQHPMFNVPTTGVIVNDMFYYVANAQFGSLNKGGALFPLERLYKPVILKVRLSEEPRRTSRQRNQAELKLESVATGLEIPWAIGFAPNGRIFLTERPGRIRVIENGQLKAEPWATLAVVRIRAVALGPDGYLYFGASNRDSDGQDAKLATALDDRLFRFYLRGGEK